VQSRGASDFDHQAEFFDKMHRGGSNGIAAGAENTINVTQSIKESDII
jgi:hypothetical protein